MTPSDLKSRFYSDRPVLLLDADEVLLKFVERLDAYLQFRGYTLDMQSFQLSGNVRDQATGGITPQEDVRGLIGDFFDHCVHDVEAVDGVADILSRLSADYQIAILSNVPSHCRGRRAENLRGHGMDYPVLANAGGKGPAVADVCAWATAGVVFIDDLPPQHASVAKYAPSSHRIHTVADPRLAKLIEKAAHAHVRIDDWAKLETYLKRRLEDDR